MDCAPQQLVPQGPGIQTAYQGCAITGAGVNAKSVPGAQYLQVAYQYTRSHLWRNFAVVIAFTILYILVTVWAAEVFDFNIEGGGALVFKRSKAAKQAVEADVVVDEEKAGTSGSADSQTGAEAEQQEEILQQISESQSVFTWEDVKYTVPYQGGERQLLNGVNGYAKPGIMVALVGASGAGKTTLLNTLAQRQTTGVVTGDMLVDGRELGREFQRGTGFCEQQDLHDMSATIREALEFSAILRQDRSIPRAEKIDYVDKIIDLLELRDMQDAIIGCLGVEQRKRLTIVSKVVQKIALNNLLTISMQGVELAAKPSLLLVSAITCL